MDYLTIILELFVPVSSLILTQKKYWQNYSIKKRFTEQAQKEETLSIFKVALIKFSSAEIRLSQSIKYFSYLAIFLKK